MKGKRKRIWLWRGLSAVSAFLLAFVTFGSACAKSYSSTINSFLDVTTSKIVTDENADDEGTPAYMSSYGDFTEENLKKLEADVYDHIVEEEEEGAVLLQNNDDALPLAQNSKISLFGLASYYPLYHTASAGSRTYKNDELTVDYKEAFTEEGFEVNETLYNAYSSMEPRTGEGGFPPWGDGIKNYQTTGNCEAPASVYTDEVIHSLDDYHDAAIVVLSREAGEGSDMPVSEVDETSGETISSLSLHQNEKDMLNIVKEHFDTIIVIINTTYFMELDWLEDYDVDACLWIGSPGNTGLTGVARIIAGRVNPSGRLSDTFAASSLSAPAMANSCGNLPTWSNVDEMYSEGIVKDENAKYLDVELENIYIGYKYYETRYADSIMKEGNADSDTGSFRSKGGWNYADEMCFTFGWGMSYTSFQQTITGVVFDADSDTYTVEVRIDNTGDTAGKCAAIVYAQTPYGAYEKENEVEKSAIQFAGYEKSGVIAPGESQVVKVPVERYLLASYDQKGAKGYILSAGDTYFAVGESSHDALNNILSVQGYTGLVNQDGTDDVTLSAESVYMLEDNTVPTEGEPDTETYRYAAATGEIVTNRFEEQDINYWSEDTGITVTYLSRSDWGKTFPTQSVSIPCAGEEMQTLLQGEVYEMAEDAVSASSIQQGTKEAVYTFAMMKDVDYEDEVTWNTFLDQFTLEELASLFPNVQGTEAVNSVVMPATRSSDGCNGSDAAFAEVLGFDEDEEEAANTYTEYGGNYSSVIAASWNKELQAARGEYLGEEILFQGCNEAWTGGLNLRRTPFGGRNEEYYSEDANVNYYVGSIQLAAEQAKGVIAGPKHFAGNDFETQRNGVSYFYREQAFREGSLRGFEGAMRNDKGGVLAAMGIYGRQGLTYSPSCEALNNGVVRDEWGFKGHLITDAAVTDYASHFVDQLMGYTDMICFDFDKVSGVALVEYIQNSDDGDALLRLRDAVKNTVYTFNQSAAMNGLSQSSRVENITPWWIIALNVSNVVLAILLAGSMIMYLYYEFVKNKGGRRKQHEGIGEK